MDLTNKSYYSGVFFTSLEGLYMILSKTNYKRNNKCNQSEVSDSVLKNMNIELKNLISEGKEIKAIKKYRMVTWLWLKEAKEEVDLLSEDNNRIS